MLVFFFTLFGFASQAPCEISLADEGVCFEGQAFSYTNLRLILLSKEREYARGLVRFGASPENQEIKDMLGAHSSDYFMLQLISQAKATEAEKTRLYALFLMQKMHYLEPLYARKRFEPNGVINLRSELWKCKTVAEMQKRLKTIYSISPRTILSWKQSKEALKGLRLLILIGKEACPALVTILPLCVIISFFIHDVGFQFISNLKISLITALGCSVLNNFQDLSAFCVGSASKKFYYGSHEIRVFEFIEQELQIAIERYEKQLPEKMVAQVKETLGELSEIFYLKSFNQYSQKDLELFHDKLIDLQDYLSDLAEYVEPEN